MRPAILAVLWYFFTFAQAAVQFCHADQAVEFCLALLSRENSTTGMVDFYITMGVKGGLGRGWIAAGLGTEMAGSLVFIMFSDEKKGIVISVRESIGHFEPRMAVGRTPEVDLIATNITDLSWQEAGFICYSCNEWPSVDATSTSQPWIWSANIFQNIESARTDYSILKHNFYGHFFTNMPASFTASKTIALPSISGKESFGANDFTPDNTQREKTTTRSILKAHGLFMGFAFLVLFPSGIIAMSFRSQKLFMWHVTLQLTASVCCFIGGGIQLLPLLYGASLHEPHQVLGLLLMFSLLVQLGLGYYHHILFLRFQRKSLITFLHTWLGELLVYGGSINTGLGIQLANRDSNWLTTWAVLAVIEVFILMLIKSRKFQVKIRCNGMAQEVEAEEESILLGDRETEEHSSF